MAIVPNPTEGMNLGGGVGGDLFSNNPWMTPALLAGGAFALGGGQQVPYTSEVTGLAQGQQGVAGQLMGLSGQQAGLAPGLLGLVPQQQQVAQGQFGIAGTAGGEAEQLFGTGNQLLSSLQTGHLPPGAEQTVQNYIRTATAGQKSNFARLGLTGSTMEAGALSDIQDKAAQMRFQIEQQTAQTGLQAISQSLQALGLSGAAFGAAGAATTAAGGEITAAGGQLAGAATTLGGASSALQNAANDYTKLAQMQVQRDTEMFKTISGFASALGKATSAVGPAAALAL